jgi:predicted dehydrogenase
MSPLRIGILGAARIAPTALIKPARRVADVEVSAVAARDAERAGAFAAKHGIPRVHTSYDDLVTDPDIDAIYNPLPNGLHGVWTIRAIEAGKHVLCEKPFTANADEAREVAVVARQSPVIVMEAFHYRYHPLVARLLEIIASGELGTIERIETSMCVPIVRRSDIRWQLALAGGALMDVGCYTIHLLRTLAGAEPEVTRAEARLFAPDVDRTVEAAFRFADGRTGRIQCSMLSAKPLALWGRVTGDRGQLRVLNPYAPQFFHRIVVKAGGRRRVEHVSKSPTYLFQLEAFAAAVLRGGPIVTGVDDSIATMQVIDDIYRAAGLEPRRPSVVS